MSRPLRIEYPGAYYHVMNRGLTDQSIFVDDRDCFNFLGLIEDAWRRWPALSSPGESVRIEVSNGGFRK